MKYVPMVMLTTSKTTTSWMFAVLAYTSVTGRYVATMFASFREPGWHCFLLRIVCISLLQQNLIISPSKWVPIHPAEKSMFLVPKGQIQQPCTSRRWWRGLKQRFVKDTDLEGGWRFGMPGLSSKSCLRCIATTQIMSNNIVWRCGIFNHASTAISYECT